MSMPDVMDAFEHSGAGTLPVTDTEGRFVGFIQRSRLLASYRKIMKDFSEE